MNGHEKLGHRLSDSSKKPRNDLKSLLQAVRRDDRAFRWGHQTLRRSFEFWIEYH
jgi:hypothetical protein